MTPQALANTTAHAAADVAAKMYVGARFLFLRFAAVNAQARIHRARIEAEIYRDRYRLRTKNDDDLPIAD